MEVSVIVDFCTTFQADFYTFQSLFISLLRRHSHFRQVIAFQEMQENKRDGLAFNIVFSLFRYHAARIVIISFVIDTIHGTHR